jgi:glycosyltransferase involved in cell wall biosynthesis
MRIAIIVRILWSAGAQKIAINEAIELTKQGHEVDLIFLRRGETWRSYEELLSKVKYRVISEGKSSFLTSFYSWITGVFTPDRKGEGRIDYDLLRGFPRILKDEKVEKIICHDEWAGIAGFYAWKKLRIPYEVFLHERLGELQVPILGKLAQIYRMKILKNASKIYSVTEKIANDTFKRFGLQVTPDPPGFDKPDTDPDIVRKTRIVSISMWDGGRNPFFFIELEKLVKDYDILLLGNWRNKEYYSKFVSSLPKGTHIATKSNLSETEKMELIHESKFLVRFGTNEYGLATAVIEAISYGTPVIINSELGTADMIKDYGAGFVLDSTDPNLVAEIVANMTEQKYEELLKNVLILRESWTWREHAGKLL